MILCVVVFAAGIMVRLCGRRRLSECGKRMLEITMAAALLGGVAGSAGKTDILLDGNRRARRAAGEGSYEQELVLIFEEDGKKQTYMLTVPEQILTEEEQRNCLEAAKNEIMEEFLGENASLNEIREQVRIRDRYQDGRVVAEWSFDDYRIMDLEGNVVAEDLPEEGKLVKATVSLMCGTSALEESFYFQVFPKIQSREEELLHELEKRIRREGEMSGTVFLELPESIGDQRMSWEEPQDRTPEKVLLLGMLLAAFVPFIERSRRLEEEKKRDRMLEREYPDIVSKMALLLGAGMTLQGAFRKIAFSYDKKKRQGKCGELPAYEEMLSTCRELESGRGEGRAYESFGARCKRADYRKFGNILAQNLRKGSQGVVSLLEQEAENAFEERKSAARRYGEEAGTKLLVPMILMLGIVMVILMVPAILTFQI